MSSTPHFTTGQLAAARAQAWHQTGEPLLTLDAVRDWLSAAGLLLFAPRPQHLPAPAPSLVEATLGAANEAPTASQTDTARSLVARLVSEGNALPLNLLGEGAPGTSDIPDFIVSAPMFSFIFTLRGDKLWKQAPSTSGTGKVTPLALAVYEVLAERGALSAAELASELGRELTEAAIVRALNELWTHLRVIPLLQQGDVPTLWELTSRRFTKAIKAGANAGQPTALSSLVSLYLAQALLATEDEVATFLSPLAARSRIREVLHGLSASRQIEPIVLEGKALLHIPGTLPEFPAPEAPAAAEVQGTEASSNEKPALEGEGRIKRFSSPRAASSDLKGKPARSFTKRPERSSSPGRSFSSDRPARPERERRPFRRVDSTGERPAFTRPWDEDRKPRRDSASAEGQAPSTPERSRRDASPGDRPARKPFGSKPSFGSKPPFRRSSENSSTASGERKPYPRRDAASGDRSARKPFGSKPPFRRSPEGSGPDAAERRPRRDASPGERSDRPRRAPSDGEHKAFPRRDSATGDRPARKPYGSQPSFPRRDRDGRGVRPARARRAAFLTVHDPRATLVMPQVETGPSATRALKAEARGLGGPTPGHVPSAPGPEASTKSPATSPENHSSAEMRKATALEPRALSALVRTNPQKAQVNAAPVLRVQDLLEGDPLARSLLVLAPRGLVRLPQHAKPVPSSLAPVVAKFPSTQHVDLARADQVPALVLAANRALSPLLAGLLSASDLPAAPVPPVALASHVLSPRNNHEHEHPRPTSETDHSYRWTRWRREKARWLRTWPAASVSSTWKLGPCIARSRSRPSITTWTSMMKIP